MAPRTVRYRVVIDAPRHGGGGDIPGFLDMLRYDAARVVTWDRLDNVTGPGTADRYSVTLDSEHFTPDRWASFGIPVEVIR